MTGGSEQRPNDPVMILFRVRACHVPKEAEPSLGYGGKLEDSLSDSKVGDVSCIRDSNDITERPGAIFATVHRRECDICLVAHIRIM